jgi:hypothetical protein
VLAITGERFDDLLATAFLPQTFEDKRRPDAADRSGHRTAIVERVDDDRLGGKARAGSQ